MRLKDEATPEVTLGPGRRKRLGVNISSVQSLADDGWWEVAPTIRLLVQLSEEAVMDAVDDLCRPDKVGGTWLTKLDLGMIRAHALRGRDSSVY